MTGIPSLPTPFVKSLIDIIQYNNEYVYQTNERINIVYPQSSYHSTARNDFIRQCEGEWLLMLDTDHEFPPDTLGRLLFASRKYRVDVITGFYQQKKSPFLPVIYNWDCEGIKRITEWEGEIFEIDAAGAGCLFIKWDVLDYMIRETKEMPFTEIGGNSEDISFFKRLAKLGIKAYCLPDLRANHLAWQAITPEMMEV